MTRALPASRVPWTGHQRLLDNIQLTFTDNLKRAFPFLLLSAYGMFLCSYFFFDEYSEPYRFFARGVFFIGIFAFAQGLRTTWRLPLFQIIVAYMLYLLLSAFWSDTMDWFRLGQKFVISIYLLNFIAITCFLVHWNPGLYERMLQLCVIIAAGAAITSILVFYREHAFPGTRLEGIGSLTNVNIFANIYGIFALLSMGFALRAGTLAGKALFFTPVVLFICFAWFGQSRTAFVSMIMALSVMAALTLPLKRLLYGTLPLLAILAAVLTLIFPDVLEQAFLRGKGLRPMIWAQTWEEIQAAPIFGHGLTAKISVTSGQGVFETVHNAYLQVLWQGGVIGLCLFLLLLGVAFRYAWSWGSQQQDYTIFCMLLFTASTMMTGVDTLIARPRDQWLLFWLPLAMLLSYRSMAPRSPASLPAQAA